jgi:hypothetical protein
VQSRYSRDPRGLLPFSESLCKLSALEVQSEHLPARARKSKTAELSAAAAQAIGAGLRPRDWVSRKPW